MTKPAWRDESSYSRDEKDRTPTVWVLHLGPFRVAVHRHIHYPGLWLVSAEPFADKRPLREREVEAAKGEALALVRRGFAEAVAALDAPGGAEGGGR